MAQFPTSIRFNRPSKKRAAFTLIEVLMVIAVMSTVAAFGIVQFKDTTASVRSTKLQQDVAALNRAVRTYSMSGGDLETATTGEAIIGKLKTVAAGNQRSKIAGLRGSMLDSRLLGVPSTENGAPRAVWNSARKTFFVQTTGTGFQEFLLDEKIAASPPVEDSRAVTMALDNKNKWIWGFTDGAAKAVPRNAPTVAAVTPANAPRTINESIRMQLSAPVFSISGGSYPLRNFDLLLTLSNPNPAGRAEILVSINGASFRAYAGAIAVPPNAKVTTMARSLDLDNWTDSSTASQTYQAVTVPLQLAFSVPKTSVTYQEMGGAMIPGTVPLPAPLAPGLASLTNAADIPAQYQNDSVFAIKWTYDGADPLRSTSATNGSSFSGGFKGQEVSTALSLWGRNDRLRIRVAAASMNPQLVSDSPVAGATLTAVRTTLRPPLMRLDPVNGNTIIALDTDRSDVPAGAVLKYSVAGTSSSSQKVENYTGPMAIPGGSTVSAWVHPPDGMDVWFNPSNAATLVTPMPQKLAPPGIALSHPKFDHLVSNINVTLTNPNPAGSSQIFYALKQPTDPWPARTEFLPYTGPLNVTSTFYPNGFQIQTYAKSLLPLKYEDSLSSEAATTADFFGMALDGDVLLIIDASGSMTTKFANTTRFKRVIDEAINAINGLTPTQRFSVMTFNSSLHWSDGAGDLKPANGTNKEAATEALRKLVNSGGTNYEVGLKYALNLRTKPRQIVFLSDGQPNFANYLDEVAALKAINIKISTIGIGNTESQAPLREIASLTGGAYRFVMVPGSAGTLKPPGFSTPGGTLTYDRFPVRLTLTNPNSLLVSYILYTINGGTPRIYTGPFNVPYNSTVEASCESIRDDWAPSAEVTQTYLTRTFAATPPSIKLSAETFTDEVPQITMTLDNPNPAGLTDMVWWFETELEKNARPYAGPVTLEAAAWDTFASPVMETVTIFVRTLGAEGFVYNSIEGTVDLRNSTSAFLTNLRKTALKAPVFSVKGGTLPASAFPVSLTLSNPNALFGELLVSVNGADFTPYAGPLTLGFNSVVRSYIQATVLDAELWRDSPVITQTWTPQTQQMLAPVIQAPATRLTPTVKTITITLMDPNPAASSRVVYWFEGQNPATEAQTYTGPFTLTASDLESFMTPTKDYVNLIAQSLGTEDFLKPSSLVQVRLVNTN